MKHDRCAFQQLADRPSDNLRTEEELVVGLAAMLDGKRGEQGRLADQLGVAQGTVSNVLTGGRTIGDDLAARLGFRRVVRFEPIE